MVETTVSSANEVGTDVTAEAMVAVQRRMRFSLPPSLVTLWFVLTALIVGFLVLGSVQVGAGNWTGQRIRVSRVWSNFLEYLAQQGASSLVQGLVAMVAILAVGGGCALIWVAMAVRDEVRPSDTEDATPH